MKGTVCVHGLGYIGLPTAAVLANQGYDVAGYDIDPETRLRLKSSQFNFQERGLDSIVESVLTEGSLSIVDEICPSDYHIVCVPTPLTDENRPDLSYIKQAAKGIRPELRQGDVVITESTVPPGTSHEVLQPILEANDSGLTAGETFGLVYCPETVLPGNILTELRENDRVIGSIEASYRQEAIKLYRSFSEGRLLRTDLTSAELVKLIQNASRDIDISFANQVAKISSEYDVDSSEIISLANSHPRVDILSPGPGVGGHCLPIDPWFLINDSTDTSLLEAGRNMNNSMPDYVVSLLQDALGSLANTKIAILGVAYKGNVSDSRNSPALKIAELLQHPSSHKMDSPTVALTDPYVSNSIYDIQEFSTAVEGANSIIIATDHNDYTELHPDSISEMMSGNTVVDTRDLIDTEAWESSGFSVLKI